MDPHHLKYFLAIIDTGSINAAAGALGVAQPTVSQGLRALEREVRTSLFQRIGRGMVPTSAGHALVTPARKVMRDLATAGGAIPDASGQLRGRLDVLCQPALGTRPLAELLAAFHRRHPLVQVSVRTLSDESAVRKLLQDAVCEVVVTHLPFDEAGPSAQAGSRDDSLDTLPLGEQEYWVAYPPGTDAPADDPMQWDDIATPMMAVPQGGRHADLIFRSMSPEQQARRPAVILQNREARVAFSAAGAAVTWLERADAERARRLGIQVRRLEPAIRGPFGLVFQPSSLSPAAAAFVELARAQAGAEASSPTSVPSPGRPVGLDEKPGTSDSSSAAAGDS